MPRKARARTQTHARHECMARASRRLKTRHALRPTARIGSAERREIYNRHRSRFLVLCCTFHRRSAPVCIFMPWSCAHVSFAGVCKLRPVPKRTIHRVADAAHRGLRLLAFGGVPPPRMRRRPSAAAPRCRSSRPLSPRRSLWHACGPGSRGLGIGSAGIRLRHWWCSMCVQRCWHRCRGPCVCESTEMQPWVCCVLEAGSPE